ncbi:tripartite tricarboxylate transporter permease [Roseovarius sp. S1116L3]|uniref:tripartite tricarboxylate transporter permease n=1 Tax=Roseovarius roseus TaxID=3342636 RepID=UPI00372A250C
MGVFDNIAIGLEAALSWTNLFYCFFGVTLGTFLGVIPGIGVFVAISLLFPITFHLEPTAALIMLAGIYYGTTYGGSTASILLNVPGTPSNAVSCLDGYPMSKQGRAGIALLMSSVASFVGGTIGIILMMAFAPIISENAMRFGSQEYFALMLLGLIAASVISEGSALKGLAMVALGLFLGMVGTDLSSGVQRFDLGIEGLYDGVSIVALAMGLFGVAEVIASIRYAGHTKIDPKSITFRSMLPTKDDLRRSWMPMARGSGIGSFFGSLPGTGGFVASFISYAIEKKISKDPSRFGKGAIEGLVGPEAANNAGDQTAFIPTMTLGIPGSPVMAIMLGVLIIHGITPGPRLVYEEPSLFWGLVMSFWIGNFLLIVLNVPLIQLWVRTLTIPYHLLFPAIIMFVCIGVYSVSNIAFDIYVLLAFAFVGYVFRIFGYSPAPLILGFILGPMMEENFRRSLVLARGDIMTFFDRPISGTIMGVTALILIAPMAVRAICHVSGKSQDKSDV